MSRRYCLLYKAPIFTGAYTASDNTLKKGSGLPTLVSSTKASNEVTGIATYLLGYS